ncbi:MAG: glycosyltransferase family 2 protein, partial [Microbacterium sp.]|nr:glycosyltransferase family 2 protein [Microbacterium sp.]
MLAYVTSLRHPANSADYGRVEDLLQDTLRSLTNQSSDDYVVIVVGNQAPGFELPPRVHFVPVDFAPPVASSGPHADRTGFVLDKGSKIGVGLIAAKQFDPRFVAIFDADDFLHRDLTRFVQEHPSGPGWVVTDGWVYSRARSGYRHQANFNQSCGTSYVIPFEAYGVPQGLDSSATQQEVVDGFGETLFHIMGAHKHAVQWHREAGRELQPLPFRGAVYLVDTGENHSGKALPGLIRPHDHRMTRDFG